jgi:hypothetical protein
METISVQIVLVGVLAAATFALALYERSISKRITIEDASVRELEESRETAFRECRDAGELFAKLLKYQSRLVLSAEEEARRQIIADIYAQLHIISRHGYDMPTEARDKWFSTGKTDTFDKLFAGEVRRSLDCVMSSLNSHLRDARVLATKIDEGRAKLAKVRNRSDQLFVYLQLITVVLVVITSLDNL